MSNESKRREAAYKALARAIAFDPTQPSTDDAERWLRYITTPDPPTSDCFDRCAHGAYMDRNCTMCGRDDAPTPDATAKGTAGGTPADAREVKRLMYCGEPCGSYHSRMHHKNAVCLGVGPPCTAYVAASDFDREKAAREAAERLVEEWRGFHVTASQQRDQARREVAEARERADLMKMEHEELTRDLAAANRKVEEIGKGAGEEGNRTDDFNLLVDTYGTCAVNNHRAHGGGGHCPSWAAVLAAHAKVVAEKECSDRHFEAAMADLEQLKADRDKWQRSAEGREAMLNAPPAQMSWVGGDLLPINSTGMRTVVDAHARLAGIVERLKVFAHEHLGQPYHQLFFAALAPESMADQRKITPVLYTSNDGTSCYSFVAESGPNRRRADRGRASRGK